MENLPKPPSLDAVMVGPQAVAWQFSRKEQGVRFESSEAKRRKEKGGELQSSQTGTYRQQEKGEWWLNSLF